MVGLGREIGEGVGLGKEIGEVGSSRKRGEELGSKLALLASWEEEDKYGKYVSKNCTSRDTKMSPVSKSYTFHPFNPVR